MSESESPATVIANELITEIEETRKLMDLATFPAVKAVLEKHLKLLEQKEKAKTLPSEVSSVSSSAATSTPVAPISSVEPVKRVAPVAGAFVPIESFYWDQDGYSAPIISVYIELDGVGSVKQNCNVKFTKMSFDFTVTDLNGKSYRLLKDNLEKDIIPEQSKMVVKANRVILKLQKVKGEYNYEHWNNLTAKKLRDAETDAKKKADPTASLTDMLKDMYEDGDENMRKIIGEAMIKSQKGEKAPVPTEPMD